MNPQLLAFVALGGAIGSVGRFAVMSWVGHVFGSAFPWGTLTVNVAGGFLMGALLELSALAWSPSPEIRALLVVGVLGGFTTFSTFTMDLYYLFERGAVLSAFAYAVGSVVACLIAFWAAMSLLRLVLA